MSNFSWAEPDLRPSQNIYTESQVDSDAFLILAKLNSIPVVPRPSRSRLKQAFLIDSDAELFNLYLNSIFLILLMKRSVLNRV